MTRSSKRNLDEERCGLFLSILPCSRSWKNIAVYKCQYAHTQIYSNYLGLRLAMACEPKRVSITVYWTKVYSLAQYTVGQALVHTLGCPDIDLRTLCCVFL